MKSKTQIILTIIILVVVAGYAIFQNNFLQKIPQIVVPGEEIARRYCGYCHLFPSPELLDRKTWEDQVLPEMGRRLGIQTIGQDPFEGIPEHEAEIIRDFEIYPEDMLLSMAEWDSIVTYYTKNAPGELQKSPVMAIESEAEAPFLPHFIEIEGSEIPQVTMLHHDTLFNELYIGNHKTLYALTSGGEFTGRWSLPSPAVDFQNFPDGQKTLLTIGSVKPSDLREGALQMDSMGGSADFTLVLDSLPRPVHFSIADLDNDSLSDVVISGFGHHRGGLTWYSNFKEPHQLNEVPGARMTIVQDMNRDGLPDIVALMAQAWESVDIYYNQGNGVFEKESVLEFSPVHGVSHLQLADFNDDGYPDLLLTNGDNWDYSMIDKPYHGIRIYLNDGSNQFEETMFYPMNGCSKAIARDFDLDGDLDIVATAFYNNANEPEKGFIYLENTGDWFFTGQYLAEAASGKWMAMEVGDFDHDGYPDVFLGSYFHNITEWTTLVSSGTTVFPEVLYLLNTTMMIEQGVFD